MLFRSKKQIRALESDESTLTLALQRAMKENEVLASFDGRALATWKSTKMTKKFDMDAFKVQFPQIYEQLLRDVPGVRRFLVK